MTKIINNISEIIDQYDTFILDQWGVMHDGFEGYDHAIIAIKKLTEANKKLVIISNSSKRKISSISRLKHLGFDKNNFIDVMTSGEMIWQELFSSIDDYGNKLINCLHIYDETKEDGLGFRMGLDKFNFVSDVKKANFILACTPYSNLKPLDYVPILKESLDLDLIMFCANPDFVTIGKEKINIFCMGTIADLYENMGGKVIILGKPDKKIYVEATKKLKRLDLSKTIAIGDSLDHDIKGANNFGIDSILISSGIHKEMFIDNLQSGLNNLKNTKKWDFEATYLCTDFSF